ncbi:MAG: SPOR domain-containing protein, partial [Cocleimonas sp.]|nr:SPOR domain-containing protein [Cocleimonas sp.]
MMRFVIILLLMVNIVYFSIEFLLGNATYTSPAPIKLGVPAIELIKDIKNVKTTSMKSTRCYTVGPYNSEKAMKLVAKQLNDFGLAVNIRRQKTKDTLNYLVYLVAQKTRQEALKVIADIKKFDIKGYHLIESGPYENA